MPTPVLISPDHRLLGWALTDLTLYGAQPVAGMTVGRPADAAVLDFSSAPVAGEAGAPTVLADPQALAPDFSLIASPLPGEPQATAPAIAAPSAYHFIGPVAPADGAPSVPHAFGSGSFVQPPVATPLQTVADGHDAAVPVQVAAAPAEAAATVADLAAVAPDSVAALASHLVDALAAPAPETTVVVTGATEVLTGLAAGATEALAATTDAVAVGATEALGAASHGVETVAATAEAAAPAAAGLVTTTTDAVAAAATPVVHATGMEGLGGTDPAGGIHTLVGMVHSADAFDLGHIAAPTAAAAQPTSVVDALAADEAPSALLGDHHDTVADHALDDHGVHVGL